MSGRSYTFTNPYSHSKTTSRSSDATTASTTTSTTESLLRNLIFTCGDGTSCNVPVGQPQLSSIRAIHEQLIRHRDVNWTTELATGLGNIALRSFATLLDEIHHQQYSSRHCDVGYAMLLLLHASMEDWDDHLLYVVIRQVNDTDTKHGSSTVESGSIRTSFTLLELITDIALKTGQKSILHQNALNVLALVWRSLEWMQQWLSIDNSEDPHNLFNPTDVPWWIQEENVEKLSTLSVEYLYRCFSDNNDLEELQTSATCQEQCKLSALVLVTSLLRRRFLDMSTVTKILSQGYVTEVTTKLIKGIQVLNHSVLPPSSSEYTLPVALSSMSVLSMLQQTSTVSSDPFHSLNQTVQSTRLVENIVEFSMVPVSSEGDPLVGNTSRWITPASKRFSQEFLLSFCLSVLCCWRSSDHSAWKVVLRTLQAKYSQTIASFWLSVIQQQQQQQQEIQSTRNFGASLPTIACFLRWNCLDSKASIFSAIQTASRIIPAGSQTFQERSISKSNDTAAAQQLLHCLFRELNQSSGNSYISKVVVARLLYNLLCCRRYVSTHDDLSRCLWTAVDGSILEKHWENILEYASTDDNVQPFFATMLDLMTAILQHEPCRDHMLSKLNASHIEAIIYVVKPKDVRFDFAQADQDRHTKPNQSTEMETPPLNNLSRMDDTSICIEHEETRQPRGWDLTIRLAAATILAHLTYGGKTTPTDESVVIVLSRISGFLNEFITDLQSMGMALCSMPASLDKTRRLFHLHHAMATPENELFLADVAHSSLLRFRKEFRRVQREYHATVKEIEEVIGREKQLKQQKSDLEKDIDQRVMQFQQSAIRLKANMTEETRQAVLIHSTARLEAEQSAALVARKLETTAAELEKNREETDDLRSATVKFRNELASSSEEVDGLNEKINVLTRQLDEEKLKAQDLADKVHTAKGQIDSYQEKCRTMNEVVHERENAISLVNDSNHQLHSNLEDLFADMCSLSQIFQANEETFQLQNKQSTHNVNELTEKLNMERTRNVNLDSKVKSLEEENDKLYRKLAKYKERLEQERKERREEHESRKEADHRRRRNGPVSYLNSLHDSNVLDKSARQSTSQHPSRERSMNEKENSSSSYYTNASQRRGKY